jgi:serine protease Do
MNENENIINAKSEATPSSYSEEREAANIQQPTENISSADTIDTPIVNEVETPEGGNIVNEPVNISDTGSDEQPKAEKPKSGRTAYRRTIALGLAGTIFCGASLGLSLGVGLNVSKNLMIKDVLPFSFAKDTDETATVTASATSALDLTPSEDSVSSVFDSVKDSVVNISITVVSNDFFYQTESTGSGSGIIYKQDDDKVYIVTNNHVVEDASTVKISITGSEQVPASLVGKDASSDLAVISVSKADLKEAGITSVTPAVFGDSDSLEVGEFVIAVGNALGQGKTVTRGIVSAVNKTINVDGKKLTVVQTDAAINPGNSGGALVNTAGEVIGINTAKLSSTSVEGTGFAIPTSVAKSIIDELMANGNVDKPYLGVQVYGIDEQFKRMYNINIDGVYIVSVESGSAAERAGLQSSDIITAIDGTAITTGDELSAAISKHKSGDKITLSIVRNGVTQTTVTATLANQNAQF